MRKCNCENDVNIASCDINVRKNNIDIVITREPDTPLISELRRQIAELQELGLKLNDIDQRLADAIAGLDIATKAYLAEVLTEYVKNSDMESVVTDLKEWANSRFMRKVFLTQEAYDALVEKEENVLYCII
jgi:predicted transcriptional regulator